MRKGKQQCRILKEIRQQIADANDIPFVTSECRFQGDCRGTCPKCEAELQYLDTQIAQKQQFGHIVAVAGISLGLLSGITACTPSSNDYANIEKPVPTENRNDTTPLSGPLSEENSEDTVPVRKQSILDYPTITAITGDIE